MVTREEPFSIRPTDAESKSSQAKEVQKGRPEDMHCEVTTNTKGLRFLGALIFCQLPCRSTFEKVRPFARLTMVPE